MFPGDEDFPLFKNIQLQEEAADIVCFCAAQATVEDSDSSGRHLT